MDEGEPREIQSGRLRYPCDLTNAEWGLVEPLIPPAKHCGRMSEVDVREVLKGLLCVLSKGCRWRARSTLFSYLT